MHHNNWTHPRTMGLVSKGYNEARFIFQLWLFSTPFVIQFSIIRHMIYNWASEDTFFFSIVFNAHTPLVQFSSFFRVEIKKEILNKKNLLFALPTLNFFSVYRRIFNAFFWKWNIKPMKCNEIIEFITSEIIIFSCVPLSLLNLIWKLNWI